MKKKVMSLLEYKNVLNESDENSTTWSSLGQKEIRCKQRKFESLEMQLQAF